MKNILLVLLIVFIGSCNSNPYNCAIDQKVLTKNDSIMGLPDYRDGYSPMLIEYDEPELESLNIKSYRLLITHSWDRDTWIYRFERTEEGGLLTLKKNYTEGYEEYLGISDTTIYLTLSEEEWKEIELTFDSNCFWTLPLSIDRRGLDGRNCVLEAFDPDRNNPVKKSYFIAARWSPEKDTEFRKICDYIESFEQDTIK
ncbi:MAG: hypothetical protein IPM74_03810 [Crocinitomicaceae bacterium]|nr:hypothetical protein [Crocinitomicaceae bacterium]MBK8925039.1 hypothetical protein [Crocinitomicaceae bacterium]